MMRITGLNITHKGLLMVLIPVVFQLLFIAALNIPLHRFAHELESMRIGKKILFAIQENEIDLSKMIWALMVGGPQESIGYIANYHEKVVRQHKWSMQNQTSDPELLQLAKEGRKIWNMSEEMWMSDPTAGGQGGGMGWIGMQSSQKGFKLFREQRLLMNKVLAVERRKVAQQPEEIAALRNTLVLFLWIGFGISCLISLALMMYFSRDIVNRLNGIAEKAQLLSFGKTVQVENIEADEIGQLENTIAATSLKVAEIRNRQAVILDNSADVICSLDAKLKFAAVGEAASKIWGHTPDQLLGKSVLAMLSADTVESTSIALERIAAGNGDGRVENVIKCGDGSLKNAVWIVLWSPEKRTFFCVVHDVTELRNVEKLKQHFISVASHDLRAPLTSVTLNVSILTESMKNELSPGIITELERVQHSAQRLTDLVNELLELDKLEAGRLSVELKKVLASDACEAARDLLFGLARQSELTVTVTEGDAFVMAEDKRLVQMISNLLSNAIKFSPRGGNIEIDVREEGQFAVISIKDEGCGMTAKECATVFEKFSQARSAKTTSAKGTGLGLAVVKALAEAHGGRVEVVSAVGKGSTFSLFIPLAASSGREEERA
ncbi:MAG: PAS domain-containing sensor histidine kinase [Candidatus Obscuribacterales bacterium]|nr:PAS domain-containing sensor histidine kinase [Candidatus Obscuribacterales bacterium]